MATGTVSISATVTPAVTLSNPVSLDELQKLGSPTVTVDSTANISKVLGTEEGKVWIVEASNTTDQSVNGTALSTALAAAQASTPTANHPAVVLLMPGEYDLNGNTLSIDTNYVHLSGVTGSPYDTIIRNDGASNSLAWSANGMKVSNLYLTEGFIVDSTANAKTGNEFRNCVIDLTGASPLTAGQSYYATFIDCTLSNIGRSTQENTLHGPLDGCKISGSNTVYLADGAIVRKCIVEPTLDGVAAINAKIYHCALKASLGANITNDIGTPNNVEDSDVAV